MDYKTRIIHTEDDKFAHMGAASVPIYQTSTFAQSDPVEFGAYRYSRASNPTRDALEHMIAVLESGRQGFAFSSGMAAISSVFLLFKPGDHIVVSEDVYGGTFRVLDTLFRRWGLRHTFADISTPDKIEKVLQPQTRAIFAETPSNPLLKITDLAGVVFVARGKGILTIIDNTFMSPYLQRPLELGFDVSIHSATKFLGGHSDLIAGLVVTREEEWGERLKAIQISFGAILGPQDSWLLMRGIKTLAPRMEAQQRSAGIVVRWLQEQPDIKAVYYPTLPSNPGRETHLRQATGGGAVLSFELKEGGSTREFLRQVRIPLFGPSLGGAESILSYPTTMSHAVMPEAERLARNITPGLVRLSVGLEEPRDLCDDLRQALDKAAHG
jgi:cysteine-S-conjugate beta-lyase